MNKLLLILLLLPLNLFSQSSPKNDVYDAKGITEHILHGDLYVFCLDSVKFVRERKPNCYVISYISATSVHRKTEKIFKLGKPVFAGAMDDGSIFTIEVYEKNNPKMVKAHHDNRRGHYNIAVLYLVHREHHLEIHLDYHLYLS